MGLFRKAPPKQLTIEELKLEFPIGYGPSAGQLVHIKIVGEKSYQKHINQIVEVVGKNDFPIYLKPEPDNSHDKNAVAVMSNIDCIGYIPSEEAKAWQKRSIAALKEKKIFIGTARAVSRDGSVYGIYGSIIRPNEIAIDTETIKPKQMTEEQIAKALIALQTLASEYPETAAQVKAQAKKAVKQVSILLGHVVQLDANMVTYSEQLRSTCEEFILQSESFADSEDDMENEIDIFIDDWKQIIAGTGAYAPRESSKFAKADTEKTSSNPGIGNLLAGKSVVLSGDFEQFSRSEGEDAIKKRGGRATGSVSKSTFALVIGVHAGEVKIARAKEFSVPIINGEQFLKLLETGSLLD